MIEKTKNNPIIIPETQDKKAICDFVYQTAKNLSSTNPVYIFLLNSNPKPFNQNIIKHKNNIFYVYPLDILPLKRFKIIKSLNKILSFYILSFHCINKYKNIIIYWIFYPQVAYLVKYYIFKKNILFDIVDNFTSPDNKISKQIFKQKIYLLKKSKIVTSTCQSQINYYKKIFNRKIILVPQGFNIKRSKKINPQLSLINPINTNIGYIGNINNRFDFKLLFNLIKNTPQFNYIFVGPISKEYSIKDKPIKKLTDKLFSYKNVLHIEKVKKDQIHQFIEKFDFCIIPYDTKEIFNKYSYPMKTFEYLYFNKPIISTNILALKNYSDYIFCSNNYLKWIETIKNKDIWFNINNINLSEISLENSWHNKIKIIKNEMDKK